MFGKLARRLSLRGADVTDSNRAACGPLLITVGPQLCGKTSFVQTLGEKVLEVSIEDILGFFETVSVETILKLWNQKDSVDQFRNKTVFGISLSDRVKTLATSELALLTLLFSKQINFADFKKHLAITLEEYEVNLLVENLMELLDPSSTHKFTTKTIDIPIPEAEESVRAQAVVEMKRLIKTEPGLICWSNSNLLPSNYKDILAMAAKYQRTVRFIRWGQELPCVSLSELIKRNIIKFLSTGRYVEVKKILQSYKHADIIKSIGHKNMTQVHFARNAGFHMDEMGRVFSLDPSQTTAAQGKAQKYTGSPRPLPTLPPGYQPLPVQSTNWSKWTNEGVLSALGTTPLDQSDSLKHEKKDDNEAEMLVTPLKSTHSVNFTPISSSASTPDNFKPDSNKVIATPQLAKDTNETKETREDEKTSLLSEQSQTEQQAVALTPEQIALEKREKEERIALAAEWTKALEAAREAALKARRELAEKMAQDQSALLRDKSVQEIKSEFEPEHAENTGISTNTSNSSIMHNINSSPGAPSNGTNSTEHKRKSSKSSLPPLSPSVSRRNSRNIQDHSEFKFVDCDKLNSTGADSRVQSGDFSDGIIGIAAGVGCGGDDKTTVVSDVNQEKRNSKRLSNPHAHVHSQHPQHHHHLHTEMTEVVDDNVQLTESQKHAIDSYQAAHFPLQDSNNISRFNFSNASSSNNNSNSNSTNNSTNNSNYNMSVVSYNDNDSIEIDSKGNKSHNNTNNGNLNTGNINMDEDIDENVSDASSVSTDEAVERAELFLAKQKSQLHSILSDADHNTLRTTSLSRHNSISSQFNVTSEHNSRPNSEHNSYNNSRNHSRKNSATDQINNNANGNVNSSGDNNSGGNSSNQRTSLFKSSFSRAEFSQNPVEENDKFWATITALSNNQNNQDIENRSSVDNNHDDDANSIINSDSSDSETEIDNIHKISAYKIEQPMTAKIATTESTADSVVLLPTLSREKSLELIDDIAFFEAEEKQEYTKLINETDKNIADQPVVPELKKNKNTTHLTIDTEHTDADDNNNDNNTDDMDDENENFSTKISTLFSKKSPHSASAVAAVARANELYLKSLQENNEINDNNDAKHNISHNESKHETALPTIKSDSVRDINHAPHSAHSVHTIASHTATSPHDEHVHFQSEIVEHGPYHLRSTHNLDPITGTVLHTHTVEEERELAASKEKARILPIVHLKSPSSSRNISGKFNKSSINGSSSGDNSRCTTPTSATLAVGNKEFTTSHCSDDNQSNNIKESSITNDRKHFIPTPIVTTFSTSDDSTADGNSTCYNADVDTTRNADIRKDHRGDLNNENSDYPKMTPNTRVHIKAKEWIENDKVVQYALENYSRDSQAIIAAEIKQMDATRHDHHTLLPFKDTVPGKSHFVDENDYFDEETASLIAKSREQDENKKVEKFAHDNYPASAESIVAAEIKRMDTERHDHKLHSIADQNKKLHNVSENEYFDEETASLIAKSREQIEKQKVQQFAHVNYSGNAQAVIAAEIKQMDNERHDHKLHNAHNESKSLQNVTENEYFDEVTASLIAKSRVSSVEQSENQRVEQFAHENYSNDAQTIINAEIKQMDIQRHDHKLHPSKYNTNDLRNVSENEYFDEETANLIAKSRVSAMEDSENKKVEKFAHENYPASAEAIIAAEIKQMDTERHDHKLHTSEQNNKNMRNVSENEYFDEETANLIAKSRISFEEGHKTAMLNVNINVKSNDVVLDSGSDDDDLQQHSTSQHVMKRNAGTSKPESVSTSSNTTQNKSPNKKNAKVTFTREQTPAQDGNNPFCFVNELFCGMF